MNQDTFLKIRTFIRRNARPLDYIRWKVHFEGGAKEEILTLLAAYQNDDGGLGHGLEPDFLNPFSTPMATCHGILLLKELGIEDKNHPVLENILRYLASGAGKRDGRWLFSVKENENYPHAPWWGAEEEDGTFSRFNPTAPLLRFILDHGEYETDLYYLALNTLEALKKDFMEGDSFSMHDLIALEALRPYLDEERLNELLEENIEKNPENFKDYVLRPTHIIKSTDHPLYRKMRGLLEKDLEFLEGSLREEGYWDINWAWGAYEESFYVSRNFWRSDLSIHNLLLLKSFVDTPTSKAMVFLCD
jgi:hypothetical protein